MRKPADELKEITKDLMESRIQLQNASMDVELQWYRQVGLNDIAVQVLQKKYPKGTMKYYNSTGIRLMEIMIKQNTEGNVGELPDPELAWYESQIEERKNR